MQEEYSREVIKNILLNSQDLYEIDNLDVITLVVIRCDIELAVKRLGGRAREIANTLMLDGKGAMECRAVSIQDAAFCVEELYFILNVEGVAPWYDPAYRERIRIA